MLKLNHDLCFGVYDIWPCTYVYGPCMDLFRLLWDFETRIRPIWDLLRSYLCIGEPLLGYGLMDFGLNHTCNHTKEP